LVKENVLAHVTVAGVPARVMGLDVMVEKKSD
jgi:serine acetyltransferase